MGAFIGFIPTKIVGLPAAGRDSQNTSGLAKIANTVCFGSILRSFGASYTRVD